ncbi:plasmid mobilization relaxosome protein MobC [Mucilaginibacter calamicampi]|uniref:Plasmid mobilization relaxosome protein MobC n=1 Tax=Mucilaginibacter calamicampi TaxID=1302352 RepID=A0ABW2YVX0_9SPHI
MDRDLKRTKKSGGENRSTVFRMRLTDKEKEQIQALAKQYGFRNVSKYLRSLITNNKPSSSIDRQTLLLLNAELGKEGSNLNQIARAINTRMKTGEKINFNPDILNQTLTSIHDLTSQLLELLKNVRIRKN